MLYVGNKIPKQVAVGGGNAKAVFYGSRIVWAPDWDGSKYTYEAGAYVYYRGEYWLCIKKHTPLTNWSPSPRTPYWQKI